MNIVIKKQIGRGKDGVAYLTEDNLILKVSSDPTEALVALSISALQHRELLGDSFPNIKGAWYEDGKYYILRENIADGKYTPIQLDAINFLSHGWVCEDEKSIVEALNKEPKLAPLLKDLQILFEHTGIRIRDIGSHNNVAKNFILRDFSRASFIFKKNKSWKKNNKFKIISKEELIEYNKLEEQREKQNKDRLINYINTQLATACTNLSIENLKSIFDNKEDLEKIKPTIYEFIKNYNQIEHLTFWQQKLFPLLLKNEEFLRLLENNVFYQLNSINKNDDFNIDKFDSLFDKVSEKYYKQEISLENTEEYLNKLKAKLPIPVLIEYRLPKKGLFNYCEKRKLKNFLESNLDVGVKVKKQKI